MHFVKTLNNSEVKDVNESISEEGSLFLARFQKITSSRLRALDNKIELVDELLKDLDEAYSKTFSLLTDLENKINEYKKTSTQKKEEKQKIQEKIDDLKMLNQKAEEQKEDSNAGMRVYELSKELGISSRELIDFVNENIGINIENHLKKLTFKEIDSIKEKFIVENSKDVNNSTVQHNSLQSNYDNKEKILELYKQGMTPQEIGKELKIGVGEIMLVLSLFANQEKQK
jgi:predicted DNA-binding transcriptional regulator